MQQLKRTDLITDNADSVIKARIMTVNR